MTLYSGVESPTWVGVLRAFIATDREDVRLKALADCPEVCVRGLLGRSDILSGKVLTEVEARVEELIAARRFEEAAVVRLVAIIPAARILRETTAFVPKAAEVAVPLCTSALQLSAQMGFDECHAYFLSALGNYARVTGDRRAAQDNLSTCVEEFRRLADVDPRLYQLPLAEALHLFGKFRTSEGQLGAARTALEEAIALCGAGEANRSGGLPIVASMRLDLGGVLERLGERRAAAFAYDEAIATWEALVSNGALLYGSSLAGALYNRGQLDLEAGDSTAALARVRRALAIWHDLRARDPERWDPHCVRTVELLRRIEGATRTAATLAGATRPCPCGSGGSFATCHGADPSQSHGPSRPASAEPFVASIENQGKSLAARTLSPAARLLLDLLCVLEATDRWRWLVEPSLTALWKEFGLLGDPPELDSALVELTDQALISVKDGSGEAGPTQHHHVAEPVVREVTTAMDPERARRIAYFVGQQWVGRFLHEEASPTRHTVRAGIGASMYVRRMGKFEAAFELLERRVLPVAERTGEAKFVLIHLEMVAEGSRDPRLVRRFSLLRSNRGA